MLSIIIPAHNEEVQLKDCLNSLIIQKNRFQDFEVVVVDNSSSDRTSEVARSYKDRLAIKTVDEPRLGVSFARNTGAKEARGDFFVFLDADNIVSDTFLEEIFEKSKKYDAGTVQCLPIEKSLFGFIIFWILEGIKISIPRPFGKSFTAKKIFFEVGGYNTNMTIGTNVDYLSRVKKNLLLKNKSLCHISKPIYASLRRFEKKGYISTLILWLSAYLWPSNTAYPPIN